MFLVNVLYLVTAITVLGVIVINIHVYRRRAAMTPEERKAEDQELDHWRRNGL